jgi:hypothetical protein
VAPPDPTTEAFVAAVDAAWSALDPTTRTMAEEGNSTARLVAYLQVARDPVVRAVAGVLFSRSNARGPGW